MDPSLKRSDKELCKLSSFGKSCPWIFLDFRTGPKEKIYKITHKVPGQKCFKGKAVEAVGQKLKEFMKQFALEDGDLQLDELSCHDHRYAYEHETAASICTEPFAEKQLQHLI